MGPKIFDKLLLYKMSYYSELDNYATKSDLKDATCIDTSKFAKQVDLASLKRHIYRLDFDKLETTPVELTKLM